MAPRSFDPELERRIAGFAPIDWFWLIALGVVGPALLLYWGWQS
jgi:hypothetical protein